jgi:ankyrin repeat protein
LHNSTPLTISCKNGNVSTALFLLSLADININHVDKVIKKNYFFILTLIIIIIECKDGSCALFMAAKYGYSDIVVTLLEKGAYVNVANKVTLL